MADVVRLGDLARRLACAEATQSLQALVRRHLQIAVDVAPVDNTATDSDLNLRIKEQFLSGVTNDLYCR